MSPIRLARASSRAWRGRAKILPACCSTRLASLASGWRCSRRSSRVLSVWLSSRTRRPGTPNGGLLLPPDGTTILHCDLLIALAARHKLPAVYAFDFFSAGGLMSYGTDQDDNFRLAAAYVDRILRGDKPSVFPVQAPTKFETTDNL